MSTGAATLAQGGSISAPLSEHEVLVFLLQVLALVAVARMLGGLARKLGQPAVVGELLAGVVLGPSLLGVVFPEVHAWLFQSSEAVGSSTFALAWLGVVFLLLVMGYETDLGIISQFRRVALAVAAGSLIVPMLATGGLGLGLADLLIGQARPPAWVVAAFFALALSVSALPVVGKILADLGFLRRNFGQITLAAAMTKDAVGWLILAVLSGVAAGGVEVDRILLSFGLLAVFVVFMFTAGRWLLDRVFRLVMSRGSDVTAGFAFAVTAGLIGGAITQALHVEAILGAYLVGLTLSRIRHQLPQVRERLEMVTAAFFAPVFFAVSGLRVDVTALADLEIALWTLATIVLAVGAKVVGTLLSGKLVRIDGKEAVALGAGLSPLGVMGVVVAIVGLNLGVISETGYTILLLTAVTTSLVAPAMLKWAVGRWEPPSDETDRLELESLRGESELLGATRILLPTRGGVNSVYAARVVAAVFPDAEVTVYTVEVPERNWLRRFTRSAPGTAADPREVVEALGDSPSRVMEKVSADPAGAILAESRLGYDLLVVGASKGETGSAPSSVVERVVRETGIPTMVVQFPPGMGDDLVLPSGILVPVTASRSSRVAEELGYSLAKATEGRAYALHVINRPDGEGFLLPGNLDEARRAASDLLAEAREFGRRIGTSVETEVRVAPNAEQEILDFAARSGVDLLVLGAANRPVTDRPFYGHRVSYMAEHSEVPLIVVALPSFRGRASWLTH